MQIDIDTKFVALLGKPLKQFVSARIQNVGFAAAGERTVKRSTGRENEWPKYNQIRR